MDIAIITPNHGNNVNNFPWGALSIGSYLSNVKKHSVRILDASYYSTDDFYDELKKYCSSAKIVGFSFMSPDIYEVKKMIDYVKKINNKCKIIVGGPHSNLAPEQTCKYKNIDFVSFSNGERPFSLLIDKIKSGNQNYDDVPGLIYKDGGDIKRTPSPKPVPFYDIDYKLLPKSAQKTLSQYMQVITGRGCSFKCTFCYNTVLGQKWQPRPMPELVSELKKLVTEYDPEIIYFRDENFFESKERIYEFISLYKENNFRFKWRATCRVSYFNDRFVNHDLLKQLESINCQTLKFGLESGSQRILNKIKKGHKVQRVYDAVKTLSQYKTIQGNFSFLIGLPGETYDDYKQTLSMMKFINENEPDAFLNGPQYFRIYPGGALYEEIKNDYNYYEPQTFEEWAARYSPNTQQDNLGFRTPKFDFDYPWVQNQHRFLAQNADIIVSLFKKRVRDYLKFRTLGELFFILITKLRAKFGWYFFLYDIKLAMFLRKLISMRKISTVISTNPAGGESLAHHPTDLANNEN